jgi:hypothetical protein
VRVSFGDLADRLHTTTDDAEARVSRCILAGALDVTHRLQASAVYRPVPRHAPGDFATVTSAKGEHGNFPAGSILRGVRTTGRY